MGGVLDFERITLHISYSFRGFEHCEINRTERGIEARRWGCRDSGYALSNFNASVSGDEILYLQLAGLLADCRVEAWNGFNGYMLALDGGGFTLRIELGGGQAVSARGSNAYPDNYCKLISGIEALLFDRGASEAAEGGVGS